ncbi:response regulator [Paenibacillus mendelii]|uniref:Response regulator n=1 Tax=Paenibacillus mendelii TaxID=206163 RepID=A0ABV6J886_9BACL|nr:response regulator [Paenibacillus mendelii]MCQ6561350.1 response regulator [Paenibacillus mendelii]
MYKVLIVDDENVIREGIRTSIDWNSLGCAVINEASHGAEAIEMIQKDCPDIVITDIRMPGIGGLELMEKVAASYPHTRVILLSGYSDFEYVRRAVQLGAFDYLLKPTSYRELHQILEKAILDFEAERERDLQIEVFRNELKQNLYFYRQAYLQKLILSPVAFERTELTETLHIYEMKDQTFRLLLIKAEIIDTNRLSQKTKEHQLSRLTTEHRLRLYFQEYKGTIYVPLEHDNYAIIYNGHDIHEFDQFMQRCEMILEHVTRLQPRLSVSIGVSSIHSSYVELNKAYLEAYESLQHIFYLGTNSIIFYDDLPTDVPNSPSLRLSSLHLSNYADISESMLRTLKIGNQEDAKDQVNKLFQIFESYKEKLPDAKNICIELIAQIVSLISTSRFIISDEYYNIFEDMINAHSFEQLHELLQGYVSRVAGDIYKQTRTGHKKIVDQVLALISEHYRESISLLWISESVHLNSSYLSRLIKAECNQTFTDLLTRYRLEKAKQLLRDPHCKVYEVAELVGFTDPHYFATRFKKYAGLTPSEYRDNFDDLF